MGKTQGAEAVKNWPPSRACPSRDQMKSNAPDLVHPPVQTSYKDRYSRSMYEKSYDRKAFEEVRMAAVAPRADTGRCRPRRVLRADIG